ncbi:MAG: heavy metal translocating P-type ATPase [Pseudomonadota bacterium]
MSIATAEGHCYHCGLPNLEGDRYSVVIAGITRHMCCPGCHAVSSAIVANGLENYYEFRTEHAARGDAALDNTMAKLAVYDEPELQEEFVILDGKEKQIQLTVEGITCAACGWLIEKQLAKLEGVRQISVNVSARRAMLTWDESKINLSSILQRLKHVGYESLPFQPDEHEASYRREDKTYIKKLGLAGLMTMQVMMLAMGQYFDVFGNIDAETAGYFNAISLLLTTPVVLFSGSTFYVSALKAVQAGTVNMDVPVTIAIFATYIAGVLAVNKGGGEVYFESICMFIFFLLIGRYLEHRSRHKATEISSNMLKLIPATALKWQDNEWVSVLAKQLKVNDRVLVKAGESVPIDGTVLTGNSAINESMLTGEFEPVVKSINDPVYAGTLNKQSSIEVEVTNSLKFAMMNQILRLQEIAISHKPKAAIMADNFSRYFVSAVLLISAMTYGFWSLQGNEEAFWITISVLVATCPCALGLATPSALTCAMAKLNQLGILLKRADALEQINNATDIVFDKTGTLTKGEFSIQNVDYYLSDASDNKLSKNDIDALAHALEQRSEHPIAKAFKPPSQPQEINVEAFEIIIGKGIVATANLHQCVIGSKKFVCSHLHIDPDSTTTNNGNVLFAIDGKIVCEYWITDTVQPDAPALIKQLNQYRLSILSGDDERNVKKVADALSIENYYPNKTPDGKLTHVQKQQEDGRSLIMLGDGINDAPVLAASDISIAVGNASDLAKNAADVVLLNPKIDAVIELISVAIKTKSKIRQNIGWALTYNLLVLPFAVIGWLTPWQAALGMSLSSVIVVYNSTRLMR